jgi:uncharacterized membrane protein YidH (DUF202 family)
MSYPTPPYGYPPTPPDGVPKLRGRTAVRVGAILTGLAVVLIIVGAVVAATHSLSKVDNFQRIKVSDGLGTLRFGHTGGYVAYYESDTITNSTRQVPLIPVRLTDPSGTSKLLRTKYGNRADGKIKLLHYDYHGHQGLAMWQFHIGTPGTYRVELGGNNRAAPDAVVAFGESIAAGVAVAGALVGLGVLLLIAGIITLIVGLVRRSRHKSQLATAAAYPPGTGGWPQQQWPQQPWTQEQWPSQPPQQWPQAQGPQQPQQWPSAHEPQQPQWPQQPPEQWPQQPGPPQWPPPDPQPPAPPR